MLCLVEFLFVIIFWGFIGFLESELMFFISFGKFSPIFFDLSSNSLILLLPDKNHLELLFLLSVVSFDFNYTVLSPHMPGYFILCQELRRKNSSCSLRSRMTCLSLEKIIAFDKWLRVQLIPDYLTPIKN